MGGRDEEREEGRKGRVKGSAGGSGMGCRFLKAKGEFSLSYQTSFSACFNDSGRERNTEGGILTVRSGG